MSATTKFSLKLRKSHHNADRTKVDTPSGIMVNLEPPIGRCVRSSDRYSAKAVAIADDREGRLTLGLHHGGARALRATRPRCHDSRVG